MENNFAEIWLNALQACELIGIKSDTLRKNCKAGKYIYREIKLKGRKSYLVLLSSLPDRVQNRFKLSKTSETSLSTRYIESPKWARKKADKYLYLINCSNGLRGEELKNFIAQWNASNPDQKTSYSRLLAAKSVYEESGVEGLVSVYFQTEKKTSLNQDWYKHFKKLYLVEGAPSVNSCWLMTLGHFKQSASVDVNNFPSSQTFYRKLLKDVPAQSIYLARFGKAAWNRKYGKYIDRDYSQIKAGTCWVSDHAQIDVAVLDDSGKVVFPWVTAWRDFKSSKWLGWLLHCEAPNSDHIFQSFFYSACEFGLPDDVYIDNGKDYRSRDFAGGRKNVFLNIDEKKSTAMLMMLNINPHFALPYNAQTKPIERDFLKIKEFLSKHFAGYRGGNVIERPEKLKTEIAKGQIMSFSEFKTTFDTYILDVLNNLASKGKNLKGKSPNQLFVEDFKEKKTVSKDALALFCMRTSKAVSIGRNGIRDSELQITYWADWMSPLKGEKVYLRRDVKSYQEAWVFAANDDKYLGKGYMSELIPALARTDIEKAKLKAAIASKNKDKKLTEAFIKNKDAPTSIEKMNMLKAGIIALNLNTEEPNPKIVKLSNTFMDKVVRKESENEKLGNYDYSIFLEEKRIQEPIYLYETDKYYAELEKRRKFYE